MDGSYEAPDGVDLAIQSRRADMVEAVGQRRARPPTIGDRIVFVVIGTSHAFDAAADHMNFSSHCDKCHFVARQRDRSFHRPASLHLRASAARNDAERNPDAGK